MVSTPRITQSEPGVHITGLRPDYQTYRSPHAPKYDIGPNFHGLNRTRLTRFGKSAAMFGGVLGIFGTFFLSDVPRFRIDVMEKMPIIGSHFHKETPPEDNPF